MIELAMDEYEKRLIYLFEGDFDKDNTLDLVDFLNNNTRPIDLFISSPGGYTGYIHVLKRAIEEYDDIVIYPIVECYSSALILLLNTEVPISFLDKGIVSIAHFPRIDSITDANRNNIYDKSYFKSKRHLTDFYYLLKEMPLPTQQKKKLLKGEDVELTYSDLITIFKDRLYV